MPVIENEFIIAQPITEVFNAVTDYEDEATLQSWRKSVVSVGVTAGKPLRTGSMIAMTKRFQGSQIFVNADVMELQRNKRLELKGVHGRFRFHRVIEFTPAGRETRINDQFMIDISWIFFWYAPFVRFALRRQIEEEWEALKQQLEG